MKQQSTMQSLNALDFLNGLYQSLPPEWKEAMSKDSASVLIKISPLGKYVFLQLKNDALLSNETPSKSIYNIFVSTISIRPSAKRKFDLSDVSAKQALNWKHIKFTAMLLDAH